MPIQLHDLRALEGPNIYYPQPAVKLAIRAERDIRQQVSDTLKTWAQAVGLVIGHLRQDVQPAEGGFLITTTWTTPLPMVGERIAEGVVADLEAAEREDEEYSHDDLLFAAINERKRQQPSLPVLQIYAEAQVRGLPVLPRGDGTLLIGSGSRGWVFDPANLDLGLQIDVPWDNIGMIPIVAIAGTNGKTTTVQLIAHVLRSSGQRVGHADTDGIYIDEQQIEAGDWAGWSGARCVLTNQSVDVAVLETPCAGILRRGLGFDQCDVSVVTNSSTDQLGEFGSESLEQMARVKGVVVLATKPEGYVVLNADDPLVLAMRELTPASAILWSRDKDNPALAAHHAAKGTIVYINGTALETAFDEQHGQIALSDIPITVDGTALFDVENVLAATGACLGLGIDIRTIAAALHTFTPDVIRKPN